MKRDLTRVLPLAVVLFIVIGSGYVRGRWSGRWADSDSVRAAVARFCPLPATVGEWKGKDVALDPRDLQRARLAGGLTREYRHTRTGAVVTVLLVCGRSGPVSVHTPDVCYQGAGYGLIAPLRRDRLEIDSLSTCAEFWTADFQKEGALALDTLRITWAWNDGHGWKAPDQPRVAFAASPVLYKLYVMRRLTSAESLAEHDPGVALIQEILSALDPATRGGSAAR